VVSREKGHAVPGALPLADRFISESPKGAHGEGSLLCLELLEANDVRLRFGQEVVEPLIDIVNVEGGDFQRVPFCAIGGTVPALAQNARTGDPLCW
jgi:hypothetical protein